MGRVTTPPEVIRLPMTAAELIALWQERSRRYALRKQSMTSEEVASVLAWRNGEVSALPIGEQGAAFRALSRWL